MALYEPAESNRTIFCDEMIIFNCQSSLHSPTMRWLSMLFCVACSLSACSKKLSNKGSDLLKDKDGNTYTLQVMRDNRQWMTQNLNVRVHDSYCYNDEEINCAKYGRLYTWTSAMEGCKMLGGKWRLPTNAEWEEMIQHYGGVRKESVQDGKQAYANLIQGGTSHFNIPFGGNRDPSGEYRRMEAHGFFWTATASDSTHAWLYNLGKNAQFVNRHSDSEKSRAVSVRCIKG